MEESDGIARLPVFPDSQAECRGFEPHHPLFLLKLKSINDFRRRTTLPIARRLAKGNHQVTEQNKNSRSSSLAP
jgi:hypothetical protein